VTCDLSSDASLQRAARNESVIALLNTLNDYSKIVKKQHDELNYNESIYI